MLLGNIIKQYREEHKMSLQDFANLIGSSRSYIHMLEKNVNPSTNKPINPSIETLKLLANAMNMDLDFLLKQLNSDQDIYLDETEYEKQFTDDALKKIGAIPLSNIETAKIPVLGTVKAGYDYLAQENIIDYIAFKVDGTDKENYYALNIVGDSMTPLFDNGDTVIVHKQDDFENGENCVVLINGDEATIKKVYKGSNGIELKAINPYYPSRIFSKEEIKKLPVKVIGVVEKSIRNFKKK